MFLICIHHWSQNIDLVFGNAFPVFVECDSGGCRILTDSHLGIMMLVCIYVLPDEMVVDAKQTCPMHPSILHSLFSVLEQLDPISSIQIMSGSALDVMCALFLLQWSWLKAHEKPIQSLLPAGLRLVPTAWACRRSPSPRTRAVSLFQPLFQTLKEEHPGVEDKTAKSPWRLTASTRVLSSARRMERRRSVG